MRLLRYISILLLVSTAAAQPPGHGMGPGREGGPMRERVREKIKTIKIWRLTEAVGLTPEQSEKFFPVYNKHQDAMEELERNKRDQLDLIEKLADDPNSSDADILSAIDGMKTLQERTIDLQKSYLNDISGVLSVRQEGKLLVFEENFRRNLQNIIREVRHEFGGGPGRDMRK